MGLSNKLSCEAWSFSCCLNLHRFFQSEVLSLYFPAVEPLVAWSVSLHSCSSRFIHRLMWNCPPQSSSRCLCQVSSPPKLPISIPPTGLNECFFFNSLVVRLPYSSIFWHFWLFFVFKFVVVLYLVVGGGSVSPYASILARSPILISYRQLPHMWSSLLTFYCFILFFLLNPLHLSKSFSP